MLPNFLIIGSAKSGTSSLHRYLKQHPHVFMSHPKELYFFTDERKWRLGVSWYEGFFEQADGARAIGEASVTYTMHPRSRGIERRIWELLPDARLIYLIREPIERMVSQYSQRLLMGKEACQSIDRALLEDPVYQDTSRYAMHIEQFLEFFPRDQLLILTTDELRDAREQTISRAFEFLELEPRPVSNLDMEFNATDGKRGVRSIDAVLRRVPGYRLVASVAPTSLRMAKYRLTTEKVGSKPVVSDVVKAELYARLRDDTHRLRAYLGRDFHCWGIA